MDSQLYGKTKIGWVENVMSGCSLLCPKWLFYVVSIYLIWEVSVVSRYYDISGCSNSPVVVWSGVPLNSDSQQYEWLLYCQWLFNPDADRVVWTWSTIYTLHLLIICNGSIGIFDPTSCPSTSSDMKVILYKSRLTDWTQMWSYSYIMWEFWIKMSS